MTPDISIIANMCLFTNYCAEKEKFLSLEGKEKMQVKIKFYFCKHCGKIIVIINDSQTPTVCCGDIMQELIPSTSDGAVEKHVPIIQQNGQNVTVHVGSKEHPMTSEHYIQWIVLMTNFGIQKHFLCPGDKPKTTFTLSENESIIGAYAFCNIHQLWKDNA